jgi:hypothetical protein
MFVSAGAMFVYVVLRMANTKLSERNNWNGGFARLFLQDLVGVIVMSSALFILAILGCGEAEAECRQVAVADTVYQSAEACTAQTGQMVAAYQEIQYPVVVAECRPANARPASQIRADEVKLPAGPKLPPVHRANYRPATQQRG